MTSTDYENPYRPLPIRMFNRMGRAGLSLGLSGRLDVDSLIANARRKTGLTDFGEDRAIRALEVLVESINDEARLTATGRLIQKSRLGGALVQRLRIEELLRRHPEIHDIALGTIVLVTGLQRTGHYPAPALAECPSGGSGHFRRRSAGPGVGRRSEGTRSESRQTAGSHRRKGHVLPRPPVPGDPPYQP